MAEPLSADVAVGSGSGGAVVARRLFDATPPTGDTMTQLSFGQPLGAIVQYAYHVENIERSVADFVDRLGVGPWFVRGPFQPPAGRYRGEPTSPVISLARAFAGHAMVELVVQHDDTPSVYNEREGFGFHHWAVFSEDLDADLERYAGLGYERAYEDLLPSGSRIVYVDSTRDLPGMIEVIEHTDSQEQVYDRIYRASIGWDGTDQIRRTDR
jgi:Glyoxalase/Bleomycin resistance protein/Dioxygenase superfamily